jgi:hypothetical protein
VIPHPLRRSETARDRSILLPLFAQMTEAEQDRVLQVLADAIGAARTRSRDVVWA